MKLDLSSPVNGARSLLGFEIINQTKYGLLSGYIVETESYSPDDEASHSFKGISARNSPMFEEAGTIYIYFIYGLHYCFNIVTGPMGSGQAVLIRALQPLKGIENMKQIMKQDDVAKLANGPAKLYKAMDFSKNQNGQKINLSGCNVKLIPGIKVGAIEGTTRVGIKKNMGLKHRFYVQSNSFISKP